MKINSKTTKFRYFNYAVISFVSVLIIWELIFLFLDRPLLPSPSRILSATIDLFQKEILFASIYASLYRVAVGFALAIFAGIFLGFLFGLSWRLRAIFGVFLEIIRPIPPIAWIPIAIVFFGIGDTLAFFVIFIGAFFPVLTNTQFGVHQTNEEYLEVATVSGASEWQKIKYIIWPSALPHIFTGMIVALGFAWMVVVAAEMVAARSGLGYQIQIDRQLLRLDHVVAGMCIIGILGYLALFLIQKLQHLAVPWININQPSESSLLLHNDLISNEMNNTVEDIFKTKGASLNINKLNFQFKKNNPVLQNLSLQTQPGQIISLLGKSGSGKSTLLRLISGLEEPLSGGIDLDGKKVSEVQKDVSMVFQSLALLPWRTVEQNISFPLELREKSQKICDERVTELLKIMDLEEKRKVYPQQLSGGQKRRVAIARAVAAKPKLLLMDEPFVGLDMITSERLQTEFLKIFRQTGMTVIIVTHDLSEAAYMSDRVVILTPQEKNFIHEIEINPKDNYVLFDRTSSKYHERTNLIRNKFKEITN